MSLGMHANFENLMHKLHVAVVGLSCQCLKANDVKLIALWCGKRYISSPCISGLLSEIALRLQWCPQPQLFIPTKNFWEGRHGNFLHCKELDTGEWKIILSTIYFRKKEMFWSTVNHTICTKWKINLTFLMIQP